MKLPTLSLSPRARRALRLAGYPLFYVFCLVIFARLTFPYDRVKNRIVAEFDARQNGPTPKRLEIEDVSGYWLFGVEAEGVRLISPPVPKPRAASSGSNEKKPKESVLSIDSLYGSVSLLKLIFGTTDVDFGLNLGEGEVEGTFVKSSDMSELSVDLSDVAVAGLAPLEDIVELPMAGTLAGHIELVMPEGKLQDADGKLDLTIDDLEVGNGKAKIRDTIALPKLRAGTLTLSAEAVQGKLDLKEFSANGPDFQLQSDGSLRLRDPFAASQADIRLSFKFKDGYKNKNDITRGLFGAPDSKVPGLFDLDPKIKRAKGSDGFYGWRVSGQVAKLNFQPSADGSSKRSGRTTRTKRTKPSKSLRPPKPKAKKN